MGLFNKRKTEDDLSRKDARLLSAQNKGFNRGQFQVAMINAKDALRRNAGLKGRELRQTARRMVAGIEPEQTYQSEQNQLAQRQPGLAAMPSIVDNNALATNGGGLVGSAPITERTADLSNIKNFGKAFNTAFKAGMKTFTWNGKKYGTKRDPNWRTIWGLDKPKPKEEETTPLTGSETPEGASILDIASADIDKQIDADMASLELDEAAKNVNIAQKAQQDLDKSLSYDPFHVLKENNKWGYRLDWKDPNAPYINPDEYYYFGPNSLYNGGTWDGATIHAGLYRRKTGPDSYIPYEYLRLLKGPKFDFDAALKKYGVTKNTRK